MQTQVISQVVRQIVLTIVIISGVGPTPSRAEDCAHAHAALQHAATMAPHPEDTSALLAKERLFRQVIDASPRCAPAYQHLAAVYTRLGRYLQAIDAYRQAITLGPEAPSPYCALGHLYFEHGDYTAALPWYEQGVARAPQDALCLERRQQAHALRHRNVIPAAQIIQLFVREAPRPRGPGAPTNLGVLGVNTQKGQLPFATGEATLSEQARRQLRELGSAFVSPHLADACFEIAAHTAQHEGDAADLVALSLQRATAVKDFLVQHFPALGTRLTVKGYGNHRRIAPGDDLASHARNRRVEIVRQACAPPPVSPQPRLMLDVGYLYREDGVMKPIRNESTVLQTGQNPYQIFFRPHQPCYVYLVQRDAADNWYVLFPRTGASGPENPVQGHHDYWVPSFDHAFPLDRTTGKETIYLLASVSPIPELAPPSVQAKGIAEISIPLRLVGRAVQEQIKRLAESGGFTDTITFLHQ